MNATNLLNTKAVTVGVGLIVGGALLYWVANKVIDKTAGAVKEAAGTANPVSAGLNLGSAANYAGSLLTGDPSWSVGGWLLDLFNPPPEAARSDYAPRKLQVRQESILADWVTDHG